MNSRQLQYAIELSKVGNFSQVAEMLGISQPALSKQILALEKELQVKLFDREQSPVRLTAAGEQFIRDAKELLYQEDRLVRTMEQFRSGEAGRLVIGTSPFRSQYLLPGLIKKLHERYPGVQVCLHEPTSELLRKEAAEGRYDFAIVNLPVDETVLDVIPLEPEILVLAVPKGLCYLLPESKDGQIDLAGCGKLPFVAAKATQEMRGYFDRICAKAGLHPKITVEVTGMTTAWAMVQAGIGAALLPLQFVKDGDFGDDVRLYTIRDNTYIRQPAVVHRRGQPLSRYAKTAIELLTK